MTFSQPNFTMACILVCPNPRIPDLRLRYGLWGIVGIVLMGSFSILMEGTKPKLTEFGLLLVGGSLLKVFISAMP